MASDPHTYNALGIKYVVNCSMELPFVDEIVETQCASPSRPLDPDLEGPLMQQPIHAELRVKLTGEQGPADLTYYTALRILASAF